MTALTPREDVEALADFLTDEACYHAQQLRSKGSQAIARDLGRSAETLRTLLTERDQTIAERDALKSACQRILHNFKLLITGKPVKEADEAIGEACAALSIKEATDE